VKLCIIYNGMNTMIVHCMHCTCAARTYWLDKDQRPAQSCNWQCWCSVSSAADRVT